MRIKEGLAGGTGAYFAQAAAMGLALPLVVAVYPAVRVSQRFCCVIFGVGWRRIFEFAGSRFEKTGAGTAGRGGADRGRFVHGRRGAGDT